MRSCCIYKGLLVYTFSLSDFMQVVRVFDYLRNTLKHSTAKMAHDQSKYMYACVWLKLWYRDTTYTGKNLAGGNVQYSNFMYSFLKPKEILP